MVLLDYYHGALSWAIYGHGYCSSDIDDDNVLVAGAWVREFEGVVGETNFLIVDDTDWKRDSVPASS
jgi:hypothetical protein